jgi:hypothetical protein
MSLIKYPKDLAEVVHSEIKIKHPSLSIVNLVSLFEIMYFASIKTEESEPIIFNIVYLNSPEQDSNQPEEISHDHWSIVKFSDPILFNLQNIIKLAKASDPRSSSLAVYHDDENKLYILGLIDQGNRYYDYVNYETDLRPERPGFFQASLEGPGNIVAYIQHKKIAELRVNLIAQRAINVFSEGPIRDTLQAGLDSYLKSIKRKVPSKIDDSINDLENELTKYWFSTICRLILRIKSYRHGGALLFSNVRKESGLNVKYPISYSRLRLSLIKRAVNKANLLYKSDFIDNLIEEDEDIPLRLYLKEKGFEDNLDELKSEIDGSLWFISLLSRVDGLVLLNRRLDVRGFGVEIKSPGDVPDNIFICSNRRPANNSLRVVDYNHFGTRHRSMMRYCWKYEDTVGFVISQDGDVRAITKQNDKLLIWDNIQLQAQTFIRKRSLKRKLSK